ncbi:unnamed protein product [Adineta ricciae]|uniref:Uncharacterized protein n=1 Tax=Adineta ricciae TaxID=249248 RepID=A0A815K677_ADIRI|nr:unnamed protein product [Adineta ricciae]
MIRLNSSSSTIDGIFPTGLIFLYESVKIPTARHGSDSQSVTQEKYYSPDFNPSKIHYVKRKEDNSFEIRLMVPFHIRDAKPLVNISTELQS